MIKNEYMQLKDKQNKMNQFTSDYYRMQKSLEAKELSDNGVKYSLAIALHEKNDKKCV